MSKFFQYTLRTVSCFTAVFFAVIGVVVLIYGTTQCVKAVQGIFSETQQAGEVLSGVLKGIDLVFLGIVILILGIGLYELFVKPIKNLPTWLNIENFNQLKTLLVKASITVVTISFVGKAVTWNGDENIIYYGVGIGAIIASLSYFIKAKKVTKESLD